MKRFEAQVIGPPLIAVIIAVAGVAAFQSDSRVPGHDATAPAAHAVPAPDGEVPLIGEITVTASRN